ncbi:MAG: DNA alkylation repair protein [Bacteroidaceae bacterium]|jgi:3-methyladenine DNA glycosylase AlkD|nr:DNA alkylation repair protein [Bacteroidaceae bacterium]
MTLQEKVLDIKKKLRLNMNGVASTSMREAGIGYKLNFGVGLPQLKEIASETGKDPELAVELWKENIRECRILAALIYPEDKFMADLADLWVEQIEYPDLAEVCSMYLFSRMPGASEQAFRWIASDNGMVRYCGFLMLAHMLRGGREMGPRYVSELKDQAQAAINGSDLMCAQAATAALNCLGENG